jgi:hypothetical protein
MTLIERFLAYAADFEKTVLGDDWSRLEQYFGDDTIYRVESGLFGCELTGGGAILAGMKKSLDGFDRRFAGREIAVTEGPEVEGNEMSMAWAVTYNVDDHPPFVLRGRSRARLDDGRITLLVDSYDPEVDAEATAWMQQTGIKLDPTYV